MGAYEAFVAFDVAKLKHAVVVAEGGATYSGWPGFFSYRIRSTSPQVTCCLGECGSGWPTMGRGLLDDDPLDLGRG